MNLLQNLSTNKNYFVTINPYKKPQNIINETVFEHPIYSTETLKAQKEVMKIQRLNSTYYCGAYLIMVFMRMAYNHQHIFLSYWVVICLGSEIINFIIDCKLNLNDIINTFI